MIPFVLLVVASLRVMCGCALVVWCECVVMGRVGVRGAAPVF